MNAFRDRTRLFSGLAVTAACIALAPLPAFAGEGAAAAAGQAQQTPAATAPPPAGAPAGGMIIYVDPQTGQFVKEPAPGTVPLQLPPHIQNAFSTSDQGLFVEPSSVPGGGEMVNLQGRFRSPVFATTDANGKLKILHPEATPGAPDHK